MAVANENGVKYAEITDEIIADVKKGIELFVKEEEYWAKFGNKEKVPRGHKTFTYRKLVKPLVKEADVVTSAEYEAPRPSKFSVQTFEKTVNIYRDKFIYSKEDLMYHFDDTVKNGMYVLREIVAQKKEWVKGKPFVQSRAIISYDTSLLNTMDNASIILKKNDAKRWDGVHWLMHTTPEGLKKLRGELTAKGVALSEPTKKILDSCSTALGTYGDFIISVTASPVLYKNSTTQYVVFMGKRGIDGKSPVSHSLMEGESELEVFNNGLGSGVLVDVDGNYTSDDNHQQGSIGINVNGLGACVNDDLCILDCEVSINEIGRSTVNANTTDSGLTGFKSQSPECLLDFVVKAAADSTTISSPTITVKEVDSSGATVSAIASGSNAGKYNVLAGNTYYYSVAKADYTTQTGTIKITNTGNISLVISLVAATG